MTKTKLDEMFKVEVTAPLRVEKSSLAKAAEILKLPAEEDRQPDLQYITAIFVSTGQNKNGAVFLGSELFKARKSVSNKAVDIEHDDKTIIGHIIDSVFVNTEGAVLEVEEMGQSMSVEDLDKQEMDIAISAVIHKARFPEVSEEIIGGQWMVSMEAYYRDYDIKVGDMIIPRDQAEELGYDKLVGKVVRLRDGKKELGFHLVGRVLRDIVFAGVGIVKNPANERSIILEAAALKDFVEQNKETASVCDISKINIINASGEASSLSKVDFTRDEIVEEVRRVVSEELKKSDKATAGIGVQYLRPGTCVNYKKYVYDLPDGPDNDPLPEPSTDLSQYPLDHYPGSIDAVPPGSSIVREHYCNLFDLDCSARPGDATLPTCWRNVLARTVKEEIFSHEEVLRTRRLDEGLVGLQNLIDDARKFRT